MNRRNGLLIGFAIFIALIGFIFYTSDHHKAIKSQQQTKINNQDNHLPSNAVLGILPYYSPYFELNVEITANKNPNILFTYLAPPPDSSLPNSDEPTAISNAEAWLTQQGISLSHYTIINTGTGQSLN